VEILFEGITKKIAKLLLPSMTEIERMTIAKRLEQKETEITEKHRKFLFKKV